MYTVSKVIPPSQDKEARRDGWGKRKPHAFFRTLSGSQQSLSEEISDDKGSKEGRDIM